MQTARAVSQARLCLATAGQFFLGTFFVCTKKVPRYSAVGASEMIVLIKKFKPPESLVSQTTPCHGPPPD